MKRKAKTGKITPTEHSKRIATRMRARLITDTGCRAEHDVRRDANGDAEAFTGWRAVVSARLVDADYTLVLDVDRLPAGGRLDGLRVSAFEGLGTGPDHGCGDVYACFSNGRAVPLIREQVKAITDPAEITARELRLARILKTRDAERTAELEQDRDRSRGPVSAFSQAAHQFVRDTWPSYVEMRNTSKLRATRDGFVKHPNFTADCKKHGITCGADVKKIQDCERKKSVEVSR